MKKLLLLLLLPMMVIGQVQIGEDIDGLAASDNSGRSVSLSSDGNTVAIGATGNDDNGEDAGHVRIFSNESGEWTQIGNNINGEASFDQSGWSISLSADGNTVAIGAIGNDGNGTDSGSVRVFSNESGEWNQIGGDIDGRVSEDFSGNSICLSSDGNFVAIAGGVSNNENLNASGYVRIFFNESGEWIQIGNDIIGEASFDQSGWSISLSADGNTVAIGAIGNDGNGAQSGHVRIFSNESGEWNQIGNNIDGETSGDFSGRSVSLSADSNTVAIGSMFNDDNGQNSGHVRVFSYEPNEWTQIGNNIDGEASGDISGGAISLSADGHMIAIGATENDDNGVNSGHVRIFSYESGEWNQIGDDIDGEASLDQSGRSISLSADGHMVAIGATGNDDNGNNSGHVRVYDLSAFLSTPENTTTTFNLYPNPTSNQVTIQLQGSDTLEKVSIYNYLGQMVLESTNSDIDTSQLATGVYILKIKTAQGEGVQKLIIE